VDGGISMGIEGEISRFEDCEGCTDVKIEGVGTAEDEHGWGIRAPFLGGRFCCTD